jgi:hypothetical protein
MRMVMNPVVYVSTDIKKAYEDDSFLGKIRDRLRINVEGESFIEELKLKVARIKLPPNFNQRAYMNNIAVTQRFVRKKSGVIAPKTFRYLDYNLLNEFQKRLFAYGVVNSIKLLLRVAQKSIRSSCIVIFDAADDINYNSICELAKECKYFILLSDNLKKAGNLSDYIIANYGVSPIVTSDYDYAMSKADFVISSRDLEIDKPTWYINNFYLPQSSKAIAVNDISFAVPWKVDDIEFSFELLGAILGQMQEKDVEAALRYNGIYLDKIKFNQLIINNC